MRSVAAQSVPRWFPAAVLVHQSKVAVEAYADNAGVVAVVHAVEDACLPHPVALGDGKTVVPAAAAAAAAEAEVAAVVAAFAGGAAVVVAEDADISEDAAALAAVVVVVGQFLL